MNSLNKIILLLNNEVKLLRFDLSLLRIDSRYRITEITTNIKYINYMLSKLYIRIIALEFKMNTNENYKFVVMEFSESEVSIFTYLHIYSIYLT